MEKSDKIVTGALAVTVISGLLGLMCLAGRMLKCFTAGPTIMTVKVLAVIMLISMAVMIGAMFKQPPKGRFIR